MEHTLITQIHEIEAGYEAACFRRDLIRQGVRKSRQFRMWLVGQPDHLRPRMEQQAAIGTQFLAGVGESIWDEDDAEIVRDIKLRTLLRTESGVLWALSVIDADIPRPQHPILIDFIAWVASHYIRSGSSSFSSLLPPHPSPKLFSHTQRM